MCAGATIISRIGEVHFALQDPKMGGLGGATSLHEMPNSNQLYQTSIDFLLVCLVSAED